jgi:hypothetical protein
LGYHEIVKELLERGGEQVKNNKGFSPVDVINDPEMSKIFEQFS